MKCTFIGHSECYGLDEEVWQMEIEKMIKEGVTEFLSGGMGDFDWKSARKVYELKKKYSHIKNILVIPYLTFNIRNSELFDEIIYPEGFEKYHFKSAIIKRNMYLVDNSNYAICYVKRYGGAFITYSYAKRKNLVIVDL